MTAKEYLQQVKLKEAKIKNLRRDKESLEEMLYSLGGNVEGDRVQSTKNFDKFGTVYGRIDEAERKIDAQIGDLVMYKIEVSEKINELKNAKYMTVLNLRYIHFMSWEKIADSGFDVKYSVRHILKMHGLALLQFEEIHREMLKNRRA